MREGTPLLRSAHRIILNKADLVSVAELVRALQLLRGRPGHRALPACCTPMICSVRTGRCSLELQERVREELAARNPFAQIQVATRAEVRNGAMPASRRCLCISSCGMMVASAHSQR